MTDFKLVFTGFVYCLATAYFIVGFIQTINGNDHGLGLLLVALFFFIFAAIANLFGEYK